MSLYSLVHGENEQAEILLAMLGLNKSLVPRYRDCYWTGSEIAIHTRTGGGNRDFYDSEDSCRSAYPEHFDGKSDPKGPWNLDLRALPTYLRDEDDDYDSTYATFYFAIPGEFADAAKLLTAADATPAQRWKSFLNRLENGAKDDPQVKRVTETLAPAFKKLIVRSRSGQ